MIEILAVSTVDTDCGIAAYLDLLRSHLPSDLILRCDPAWLDPRAFFAQLDEIQEYQGPQVVWMNFHAALHSRWDAGQIERLRQIFPVVVTYHDTGVPVPDQCRNIYHATVSPVHDQLAQQGRFIVHEPCPELGEAIYLRQGIPPYSSPYQFHPLLFPPERPVLGTVGFPFPWKNYDLLAQATTEAGWSLLLLAPRATAMQIEAWRRLNPHLIVKAEFLPQDQVVSYLAACDATAFFYMCANTGTSGAIRQGIAARKPVLATESCRQFRDLWEDLKVGRYAVRWLSDLSPRGIANALGHLPLGRLDTRIVRLAERDSWANQARQYGSIMGEVAGIVQP
jgi:glycosyltransferase involved in cell wall biosynthesis